MAEVNRVYTLLTSHVFNYLLVIVNIFWFILLLTLSVFVYYEFFSLQNTVCVVTISKKSLLYVQIKLKFLLGCTTLHPLLCVILLSLSLSLCLSLCIKCFFVFILSEETTLYVHSCLIRGRKE